MSLTFVLLTADCSIGIFDSGIGGLSVLKEIIDVLPNENIIYVADSQNLPYGEKTMEEIYKLTFRIVKWMIQSNVKMVVIACNTTSAAALSRLRLYWPDLTFVGMEPAVKPAINSTSTGSIGVMATPATFQGELFKSLLSRFNEGATIIECPCPGLVQKIEEGKFNDKETRQMLNNWIQPMLKNNVDRLVLGCTHYPFVSHIIKDIAGTDVDIINPAPAIAKRIHQLLSDQNLLNATPSESQYKFYSSGDVEKFHRQLDFLGFSKISGKIMSLPC